jgi:hypothetical protein
LLLRADGENGGPVKVHEELSGVLAISGSGLASRHPQTCPEFRVGRRQIAWWSRQPRKEPRVMTVHLDIALLQPLIALLAGILILIVPRMLNYIVALYLILLGVAGLWPQLLR